jgi:hypothetical protein
VSQARWRRGWSARARLGLVAALAPLAAAAQAPMAAAAPAPCGGGITAAQRVENARYVVAFAPQPAPWATGRFVALDFEICPKDAAPLPEQVRVDARMPEHGHGMNYQPSVQAKGPGRWRAEGLMLHMAGRWELSFEWRQGDRLERLTHDLRLR